jgi:type I restriction enzyme S subunit
LSPKDLSGYKWKYIDKGAKDITGLGLKKSSAKLMPASTVLFSSRAPIGYIAIAENEVSTNQGFKSLIPDKGLPTEYLFQFLKQNAVKIESVASGSTFKEVSGSALKSIPVIVPSKSILEELIKRTKEFNSHLLVNQKQTQNLTKLRDTLLPQLISGKLEVPEAMLEIEKEIV